MHHEVGTPAEKDTGVTATDQNETGPSMSKRPMFTLDSDSSDDDDDSEPKPAQPTPAVQPSPSTTHNDPLLARFSSESQHAYSYAFISQSAISSRLDILKRSLEFLRNQGALSGVATTGISGGSRLGAASSYTALDGFFKPGQAAPGQLRRSSASSAALSVLTNYTSAPGTTSTSTAAEPSLTAFDSNLKAILGLLENAHVFPSSRAGGAGGAAAAHQNILAALQHDGIAIPQATAAGSTPQPAPYRPLISRTVTNPPLLLSQVAEAAEQPPATAGAATSPTDKDLPPLLDPATIRKRTKTNVASFHLQAQLLEALAELYVDGAWTALVSRTGSLASISTTTTATSAGGSSLNLSRRFGSSANLFHPLSSSKFAASNQSVFTTSASAPYTILTGNDMACLVFGVSKAEIRKLAIVDLVGPAHRPRLRRLLDGEDEGSTKKDVFLCGDILPIRKFNGQESYASFWAKRHHGGSSGSSGSGIIAWVIEEISVDSATLEFETATGTVTAVSGREKDILFPYLEIPATTSDDGEKTKTINIHDLVSGLPKELGEIGKWGEAVVENHVTVSGKAVLPCAVKPSASTSTSNDSKTSIDLLSLPHMAGVVMVDAATLHVQDYNVPFVERLFGYSDQGCRGWPVDDLVPHFTEYLALIRETTGYDVHRLNGHVLPEHLFRKVAAQHKKQDGGSELDSSVLFMNSRGIEGLHKDGHLVTLDVQVRAVGGSGTVLALWVTYSRNIAGVHETQMPSQLSLLSLKKPGHQHTNSMHGRSGSESSSTSASLVSMSGLTSSNSNSNSSVKVADKQVPKLVTAGLSDESASQPKTPTSPSTKPTAVPQTINAKHLHSTPREQVMRAAGDDAAPGSASSQYSIHIPELGARRREKKLSDFTILQKMGEGAYGKVLLAEYKEHPHLKVVLKSVVKERILVDTWVRDRKLGTIPSEIKVMAVLNKWPHANILELLDFFEDDECYHIEMEPHGDPGTDLFDLIELQPSMSEEECKSIFKQVVSAVRHLHSYNIVHRDIKDENVIIDGAGQVKLIDFGSSAFVKQGPFDVFVGTIDYAAPEVLAGRPYEGKPQDVWALGILLYTILYKENPFYSVDEIMDHELRVPHVVSEDSIDLVRRILTRDLRKRPTVDDVWAHPWLQD